jgi:hypothetical protein
MNNNKEFQSFWTAYFVISMIVLIIALLAALYEDSTETPIIFTLATINIVYCIYLGMKNN